MPTKKLGGVTLRESYPNGRILLMLEASDAVAAIIVLEDGRYLLQHRDDLPNIWYPDHWGCFGGAVDLGETPDIALIRELLEELELKVEVPEVFVQFDFDLEGIGKGKYFRKYFVISLKYEKLRNLQLHEGKEIGIYSGDEVAKSIKLTPYDAFALHLHFSHCLGSR